ncbi:glycoprotein H [Murine herpesvirus strain 4556]|uniref:Glycoprotein H n=1 Tax=Murine herpesvirus TaxID=1431748 RepID=A0A6M4EI65_9BETA|nr:glycoprotein H [Murine herpesvirus]QJQ80284.1 glycoprotein H [Murine herpesvirus]UNZ86651.1 glycoprotein H [Murine herpesvirus strain 72]UNZ86728.1 glycoprotein H [Murine herpesvirus strain 4556]
MVTCLKNLFLYCIFVSMMVWLVHGVGDRDSKGEGATIKVKRNDNGVISVYIDGKDYAYIFNVTKALQDLGRDPIRQIWRHSDVFKPLTRTLAERDSIFVTNDTIHIDSDSLFVCPVGRGYPTITSQVQWKDLPPGYLGKFGWQKNMALKEFNENERFTMFSENEREKTLVVGKDKYVEYGSLTWMMPEWGGTYGVVTNSFAFVSVNITVESQVCSASIIFSHNKGGPSFKGSIVPEKILIGKTDLYSMYFIAFNTKPVCQTDIITGIELQNLFVQMVTELPENIMADIANDVAYFSAVNCHPLKIPVPRLIRTFTKLTISHFLTISGIVATKTDTVDVGCLIQQLADLRYLRESLSACSMAYSPHMFTSNFLKFLSGVQIERLPKATQIPQADMSRAMAMLRFGITNYNVSAHAFTFMEEMFENIYREYSYVYSLTSETRKAMMGVSETLKHVAKLWKFTTKDLIKLFTIATSMCTNNEISTMVERHAPLWDIDAVETFSPCYLSLRFDFSANKINFEVEQTSQLTPKRTSEGVSGFLTYLHNHHLDLVATLPFVKCLSHVINNTDVILPLEKITYIISKEAVPGVTVYDVAETFLESKLVISVFTDECQPALQDTDVHRTVPVIYNISDSRCQFCGSIIMSYDESQGFLAAMYVSDKTIQTNLFLPESPFFDNHNTHVHYLWLMSNGSVVELRGKYRRQIQSVFILFAVISLLCFLCFLVLQIIKYIFH